ncbi:raftlin isoform X2 [Oncorhynchus mykiss]|uniref:raftlin isoform X2 n=1 Tax=Oncorhynchus mykiss TaxID=8022 RepID=UPI001877D72E|nr:raftlin isoform X2 [Oncorhynchus mykiss]
MGCGLRKLKPSEESSPGKIYSTLKRPQVETKVGVAYTYQYVDFLVGKYDGSSTLCLSSVRELPAQLQDLYQQGFSLVAVHPFIHPCGSNAVSPQHQLYRAVLIRLDDGLEKSQSSCAPYRLQLEQCLSTDQVPTPELIQGYVKKIQEAADQGVMFVGFIQEPCGVRGTQTREPETPSLSLHSSPSSVLGSLSSRSPTSPRTNGEPGAQEQAMDTGGDEDQGSLCKGGEGEDQTRDTGGSETAVGESNHDGRSSLPITPSTESEQDHDQDVIVEDTLTHNNNKTNFVELKEKPSCHTQRASGVELLALFNHPTDREGQLKYYTGKVPLRVQLRDEGVKGVEANWLDHMTQHFNNGASLVDGYFHLGNDNDLQPKSVESVFIFQEGTEGGDQSVTTTYDAIVVEQWTVIDGLQVKTDYVPLLQSLAMYGWRLTCVLPTPIIKTNSDGSLATKQVVFLQRPVLPRKRGDSKKLIFKSKANKNSVKDASKNKKKKKKNKQSAAEKDLEESKVLDDGEKVVKESRNVKENKGSEEETVKETEVEAVCKEAEAVCKEAGAVCKEAETVCKEAETPCEVEEEEKVEAETEEGVETGKERDGAAGKDDKSDKEGRVEEGEGAGSETEQERRGERENVLAIDDETEIIKGSEVEVETKEQGQKEEKGGGAGMEVKEHGVETKEETNGREENGETENVAMQQDPPDQEEHVVQEEVQKVVKEDGQVKLTNQCPEESQRSDV